jgi:hypothetical protein
MYTLLCKRHHLQKTLELITPFNKYVQMSIQKLNELAPNYGHVTTILDLKAINEQINK